MDQRRDATSDGGMTYSSNMHSSSSAMTAPTPQQMRGEAAWLDGYADGIEGTSEEGATEPLRKAAMSLRAAADQLEGPRRKDNFTLRELADEQDRKAAEWRVFANTAGEARLFEDGAVALRAAADQIDLTRECTCFPTHPEQWTTYGSAIDPATMFEPNPDCDAREENDR